MIEEVGVVVGIVATFAKEDAVDINVKFPLELNVPAVTLTTPVTLIKPVNNKVLPNLSIVKFGIVADTVPK